MKANRALRECAKDCVRSAISHHALLSRELTDAQMIALEHLTCTLSLEIIAFHVSQKAIARESFASLIQMKMDVSHTTSK